MKAIRIHGRGGPDHLVYEDAPQQLPGPGEVLVRVSATGIFVNELRWNETYETQSGSKRDLPIPGRDLSGVVVEVGPGVTTLSEGAEVYAMLGYWRDGAGADYTIALPGELAAKPQTLDSVQAAAVPLSTLTAWQGLFEHASLVAGQTVLIHGGAGGVGVFVVQLARWAGAHVIATASARYREFLRALGADEYRGKLRVFFDWAKINHMVITNPVQRKVSAPNPSIEYYSPEVIKDLCSYIPALMQIQ